MIHVCVFVCRWKPGFFFDKYANMHIIIIIGIQAESEQRCCVYDTSIKGDTDKFKCVRSAQYHIFSVCNLESGLQELSAGDDVGDLRLFQAVSNGWTSQRRVKSDHCNTQPRNAVDYFKPLVVTGFNWRRVT